MKYFGMFVLVLSIVLFSYTASLHNGLAKLKSNVIEHKHGTTLELPFTADPTGEIEHISLFSLIPVDGDMPVKGYVPVYAKLEEIAKFLTDMQVEWMKRVQTIQENPMDYNIAAGTAGQKVDNE